MLCSYVRTIFEGDAGFGVALYQTEENIPEEALNKWCDNTTQHHFTAVGYELPHSTKVKVKLWGNWQPSKYGLQLQVQSFDQVMPQDREGIIAFLCSGLIVGIGPSTARAIVDQFGKDTFSILDRDPKQLLQVKGIGASKLEKIIKSYSDSVAIRDLVAFLAPYGVSIKKAAKIREVFGNSSLQIVKSDPFQLTKVKGFGFLTTDEIARSTNVSLNHPLRLAGALQFVLEEAATQGHLYMQGPELLEKCHELLNRDLHREVVTLDDIRDAICKERKAKHLYVEQTRVYLAHERMCEAEVAKKVVSMLHNVSFKPVEDVEDKIALAEFRIGYRLSPSQRAAVGLCLTKPCTIMTGGPGTGKTTTLKVILDIYSKAFPHREILLAAPTGRASRRMADQTGMPACTLHSALGLMTDEEGVELDDFEMLPADLVVVDEFSMVDMALAYALFDRLKPGAQLIMVGDPDQLPSVGAGNVLREFLRCQLIPTAILDAVFRQAANSNIYINAQAINNNDNRLVYGDDFTMLRADDGEQAAKLVISSYLKMVKKYGLAGVQILTPMRKRGATAANVLNEQLRELVNPARPGTDEIKCGAKTFRVGDRIIQTCNREGVSNGDVGMIEEIDRGEEETKVLIRLLDGQELKYSMDQMEDLDFSYCLTIHKSQGSEYPCVIMPILREHYIMLRRNLLYTGITRAKEKVVLVGQKQAVYMAIRKCDVDKRNTVLADRIVAYYASDS